MPQFDPARRDMSPYGFSCVRWRPTAMPRPDRHNEVEVNFLAEGTLRYLLAGRRVEIAAGRFTAFWACVPHRIVGYPGVAEYEVLTIPLTWFLSWGLPESVNQAILHGQIVEEPDPDRSRTDPALFEAWRADLASGSPKRRRICALEVEARWRRLAFGLARGSASAGSPETLADGDLNHAERMARFIALHYTRPLTSDEIAAEVGLHPRYAMTLFQRTFGSTLVQHVTQHRLHHAQRLLATTRSTSAEVAYRSGFGSISRFYESFRDAFGQTPREFRRSLDA